MKESKAIGVLFTPEWKSSYFIWPLLTTDGHYFQIFIKDFLRLDPYYFNNSESTQSVFDGFATFKAFASLIDFTRE